MAQRRARLVVVSAVAVAGTLVPSIGWTADAAGPPGPDAPSGFLTGPNEGDPDDIATDHLRREAATYGLTAADVQELAIRSSYVSRHTGATHVNLNQRFDGLEVFGADTTVTVAADGAIAFVGGRSVSGLAAAADEATLDAVDAVEAAADALDLDDPEGLRTLRAARGADRETTVSDGGVSQAPIPARLGWQPTDDGLRLAWQLVIDDSSDAHLWNATVDAGTGALLAVEDWTTHDDLDDLAGLAREDGASSQRSDAIAAAAPSENVADGSSYRVFAHPLESPNDGPASVVTEPADADASPFGWHDTDGATGPEFTTTRGNNVHAYLDQDANNTPDPGFDVDGGPSLTFDATADLTEHAQGYRDAAVTNLYYWNNVFHDVAWRYGFDEPAGNFQADNYGRGGGSGDHVRAEAADGNGNNNANFSTPAADAGTPRMQMYLWPGNQFGAQNQVVVDGVGEFGAGWARFAPAPTNAGTTGTFADVGSGCDALDYTGVPSGAIAVATGDLLCSHSDRGRLATSQGAAALVVVSTAAGDARPVLGGSITATPVDVPVVSVNAADGAALRDAITAGTATGAVRKHPAHPGVRDGDLEAGIIIHEYGHGVSNRLTGGPGVNCLSGGERMGEGWSDYLAIALLLDPALDDPEEARGMGPYALFQETRQGAGIRPRPYSRNWDIQPFSYDSIRTGGWLGGASLAAPHGVGHGWAAVLWDVTWDLIDVHGFNPNVYEDWSTGGNNLAYQLVMDGMKLQGCAPGFVVGRDAIIAADALLTGGDNACTLWASFARRGLGYSAVQGTTDRNDNSEAFDTHPACRGGFRPPVDADPAAMNTVGAGSTVPLRFDGPAGVGTDVLASNSPFSRQVDCTTRAVVSAQPPAITPRAAPEATTPRGRQGLSVNNNGTFTYTWRTSEAWVDTCREMVLTRRDGTQHRAFFRFVAAD